MNSICYQLSNALINPHKHIFGGDYDINVLMIALQRQGYQCKWHDHRKKIKIQNQSQLLGYLVNISHGRKFYHKILGISGRHWVVVKLIDKQFYLLDSSKDQPRTIDSQSTNQINQSLEFKQSQKTKTKPLEQQSFNDKISSTQKYLNQVLQQEGEIIVIYRVN